MTGRTELPSGLVTFMFTDIEGSTRLARMLGEDYGAVLNAHRDLLRAALSNYSGVEILTEGDSFFVAFSDAGDAVAASVASQRALAAYPWPSDDAAPRVRMGLHTGWALPRGDEYASTEVHRAARVAAAAHGGQILCSEATALAVTTWSRELQAGRCETEKADGRGEPSAEGSPALDFLDLGPHLLRGFDDSERLFQIVAPGLERSFPPPRTPGAPKDNLPAALTPLVGRQPELTELRDLIGRHRLVTVAGGGGTGKSRLALAAAGEVRGAYQGGVWFVDVAEARDLHRAVAAAMGVRSEPARPIIESVVERCGGDRVLLVLDTCDARPVEVKRLVRRLVAACPRLDVLATSRAPIGVPGELVWRIPPLAPADAYALLVARAETARGRYASGADETPDLGRVAARLDGHPLALELAANRLRLLSAAQLAARLDDPIAALDGSPLNGAGRHDASADGYEEDDPLTRHDSLTSNLDWSYRALSVPAASLLRRLAVFAGPVELSAVEWSGEDAFGALSELADRSLVDVVVGPRYQLSGQVRSYASRRLAAAGEEHAARDGHVAWSLHTLDAVAVDTDGQPRTVSLTELSPYVKEWEAALRWSVSGGSARPGLRLAGALDPWWREHGGARTGRDLLHRLYARLESTGERVADVELASTYLVHAGLSADREERTRFLQRAEVLAREAAHPALLVRAQAGRRVTLIESGRLADAERFCRDVIAQAERFGVPAAALPSIVALAELLWRRDALDEAAEVLGGARLMEAGRPEDRGRRTVDWLLGMVALRRGDLVAAHDHLVVALRSRLRHGFRGAAADAVAAIAVRCAAGGDLATAAVLFGGAESVLGARRAVQFGAFWSAQQALLRRELGDRAFDAAYAEGAEQGFHRAVATALAVEHPDLERDSARFAQTMG
ncbi:adenylate/guanylate cyclase domain-containing protein [Actinoplanes sp. RD1]|uniref:adenylate/guanylate cyclase domain-containing protein n=1 Tax=Actinoplanes sp. RD1 TaxID=3064538 RepID=UPI002741FD0C|nr:adenylate/guanylate cyclase domain-containing protein [Actinoplanes sp. RD1]